MKKVLVIGMKGMAGHVIYTYFSKMDKYEVYGIARNIESTNKTFNIDVSQTEEIKKIVDLGFDIIINCIGILNKDAEDNPHKAIFFNSYFPHFLEHITKNTKTKIISISTDCVFSGKKGNYTETDFKDGEGFYAASKALGELNNSKDLTIRTSIIGPQISDGIGLFHWFMNQNNSISGYTNAFWSGVTTIELANIIDKTITQNISGLIIVTGKEKIDKYSLLNLFNEVFRNNKITINPKSDYYVDKSMNSIRSDFNYSPIGYEQMIVEMKDWIVNNKELYPNYNII
jgi:dTDP-4-dehydrorhamnose reductase